jgi:hypothetical protein
LDVKGEIVDVRLEQRAGKPAAAEALFKNTGNAHVKPKGSIVLKLLKEMKPTGDFIIVGESQYEQVGAFNFGEVEQWVLPGGVRRMEAGSQHILEAGTYSVEVSINYGGSAPAKFTKEFTVR